MLTGALGCGGEDESGWLGSQQLAERLSWVPVQGSGWIMINGHDLSPARTGSLTSANTKLWLYFSFNWHLVKIKGEHVKIENKCSQHIYGLVRCNVLHLYSWVYVYF